MFGKGLAVSFYCTISLVAVVDDWTIPAYIRACAWQGNHRLWPCLVGWELTGPWLVIRWWVGSSVVAFS